MSSHKVVSKDHPPNLDKLAFAKYMKNIGRAYRKQAMELVTTCRALVQVGEQSDSQNVDLRKVLDVVDDALSSAADIKTSAETDEKFENSIKALSDYEQKYHSKQQCVTNEQPGQNVPKGPPLSERMRNAKENDKASSKILNRLKQSVKAKLVEGPTKVAQFLLPGSLDDPNPKIVERMLVGKETRLEEIVWNFSRLKGKRRVTLKQNPRFYEGLPKSACEYSGDFTNEPIENFWDAAEIWVLTDERSPVFLETENKKRAFGNFWVPAKAIIFKDIGGRLEGERVVAKDIYGTPNLWHREEPTVPSLSSLSVKRSITGPANPSDLPPIVTNPVKGRIFEDWRELVRDTLGSPNISIRISTKPKGTRPESQDNWVLSSPTNPTPSSPAQLFSSVQATPTDASSGTTALRQLTALQIPEPSIGPQTALSFKTARSTCTPVSRSPLTVIPPPLPAATSHRKLSAAVPPSPVKPTPISQDSPMTVLSSLSLKATFASQARPSPSVVPQRPEPPPQKATSTGAALTSASTLAASGIASSAPSTTHTPSANDVAPRSLPHTGDSQIGNRPSVADSAIAISKVQAPSPGPQQAESEATPVKGKKQNWFQKIRKYFWD